jgi:hypothetical protein
MLLLSPEGASMKSPRRMAASLMAGLLLTGCNYYDVFLVSGYEQSSFSNDADVIFVIDNSPSMTDEAEELALNFQSFLSYLVAPGGGTPATDGLNDAVDNYLSYVSNRGHLLDYQLAITTTNILKTDLPGAAGSLVGEILKKGDPDLKDKFTKQLLCEATAWDAAEVPSDPNYDPTVDQDQVTKEYLDDLCGFAAWEGNSGSGDEEGLESALYAMCRAVDDPPDFCFRCRDDAGNDYGLDDCEELSYLDPDMAGTNNTGEDRLIRQDSTVIFVVVTDEGDGSRRLGTGESDPDLYLNLLNQFGSRYRFAVIGPPYENGALTCNSGGANTWGTERYQIAAELTGGFYNHIAEEGPTGDCKASDFSQHLQDLGELLNNLLTAFPLQAVPDITTIRVYVDDEIVPQADESYDETIGASVFGDGWSYDSGLNAIVFHGEAVPDYNQEVRIYFEPLGGMPRTLPF